VPIAALRLDQGASIVAMEAALRFSAWIRLALFLAAAGTLSGCISSATTGRLDGAPAWLQDDKSIMAPGFLELDDA
jgi:hypothetical protein